MGFHVGGNSQIKILFIEVQYPTTISSPDTTSGFDLEITRTRYIKQIKSRVLL